MGLPLRRPQRVGRPDMVGVDILLEMGLKEEWDEELWEGRPRE